MRNYLSGSFILLTVLSFLLLSCGNNKKHHPVVKIEGKDTLYLITVKPFQYNDGWGYDIIIGNKVYIHQTQVPALGGKKVFLTKDDAKRTGEMVVNKIKQKRIPSLDSLELLQANIRYK